MAEAWFEILKDPSRRATRRKPSQKEEQLRAAARRKQKKAKASRDAAKVRDYKARNTQRDFDVPDVGKKTFADRFKQFFNRRKVEGARKDYFSNKQKEEDARLQAEQDAQQRQLDIADWQASQLEEDKQGYRSQLPAVQDQAIRDADETETQRLERIDERLAAGKKRRTGLAQQAAQGQIDANEAKRLEEERKRKRREAAAGSAVLQNIKPVQDANTQRENRISDEVLADREAYMAEIKRMQEEKAKQMDAENRATTEATSVPLPKIPQNVPLPEPKKPFQMTAPAALSQFNQRAKKKPLTFQQQVEARTGSPTGIIPRKPPAPAPPPQPTAKPKRGPPPPKKGTSARYDRMQRLIEERVARERERQNQQQQGQNPNMPQTQPVQTVQQNQQTQPQQTQFRSPDSSLDPKRISANKKQSAWKKVLQNKTGQVPIQ